MSKTPYTSKSYSGKTYSGVSSDTPLSGYSLKPIASNYSLNGSLKSLSGKLHLPYMSNLQRSSGLTKHINSTVLYGIKPKSKYSISQLEHKVMEKEDDSQNLWKILFGGSTYPDSFMPLSLKSKAGYIPKKHISKCKVCGKILSLGEVRCSSCGT